MFGPTESVSIIGVIHTMQHDRLTLPHRPAPKQRSGDLHCRRCLSGLGRFTDEVKFKTESARRPLPCARAFFASLRVSPGGDRSSPNELTFGHIHQRALSALASIVFHCLPSIAKNFLLMASSMSPVISST
jgi:hypothetical protein